MTPNCKRALNSPVHFRVVLIRIDGQEYHWRYYKTPHGAFRYLRDVWGTYGIHEGMCIVNWRIEKVFKSENWRTPDRVIVMAGRREPIQQFEHSLCAKKYPQQVTA